MEIPRILQGVDINRALKDEDYRASLSQEQRQALAEVSGVKDLNDDQLDKITGGLFAATGGCRTFRCNDPDIL